jgi:hypothetical protein
MAIVRLINAFAARRLDSEGMNSTLPANKKIVQQRSAATITARGVIGHMRYL